VDEALEEYGNDLLGWMDQAMEAEFAEDSLLVWSLIRQECTRTHRQSIPDHLPKYPLVVVVMRENSELGRAVITIARQLSRNFSEFQE
jgi:hypothetical protein